MRQNKMICLGLFAAMLCIAATTNAQNGLEDVIVETYYVSDADDATDQTGGSLQNGSVTYRIFIDMAPGYSLKAVYGNDDHDAEISSTGRFFNNEDRGEELGDQIGGNRLDENTVALDSYVTIGAATDDFVAVLKSEDPDGSIVGGTNNDGGSAGVSGGLLKNDDASAGIPLTTADGLVPNPNPAPQVLVSPGLDLDMFDDSNSPISFFTDADTWFDPVGVVGATLSNTVMIAQLTTNGDISFELNVQLSSPTGETERYVANNPQADEFEFQKLNFPLCQAPTDLDVVEIGFNGSNPRVNGTWTNPEGTSDCELRGGRIMVSSIGTGNPVFANMNNTRIVTQTTGTSIAFNIVLFNNPNVPFIPGQTYGYEVRCQCQDGSGFSDWSGLTPESTFVVPLQGGNIETTDGDAELFPNPVALGSELTVRMAAIDADAAAQLIIYDLQGRIIEDRYVGVSGGLLQERLVIDGRFAPGFYTLRLVSEGMDHIARFMVAGS